MRTAGLSFEPFRLRLQQPFWSAIGEHTQREGLHLRLQCQGLVGRGEVAPLPGLSRESLDECRISLETFSREGLTDWLEEIQVVGSDHWEAAEQGLGPALPPSAVFGLETAWLDLCAQRAGVPAWQLLRRSWLGEGHAPHSAAPLPSVPLAAVVPSNDPLQCLEVAAQRYGQGVRCFKLKVGPGTMTKPQRNCAQELRRRYGERVALRFDSNRSLSDDSVVSVAEELNDLKAEFLEEPSPDPERWPTRACPLALDESLHGRSFADRLCLLELPQVSFVIVKPALLGGLAACLRLARRASSLGKMCVVSHSLDAAVGYSTCLDLARALAAPIAVGLWPLPHQLQSPPC